MNEPVAERRRSLWPTSFGMLLNHTAQKKGLCIMCTGKHLPLPVLLLAMGVLSSALGADVSVEAVLASSTNAWRIVRDWGREVHCAGQHFEPGGEPPVIRTCRRAGPGYGTAGRIPRGRCG